MRITTSRRMSAAAIATSLVFLIAVDTAEAGCRPGFVWRDAKDGDGVCVTPEERETAKKQNLAAKTNGTTTGGCRPSFVWRDAWDGDGVCVTPYERDQAKAQNANGPRNALNR